MSETEEGGVPVYGRIYSLHDPRDGEMRYIGQTVRTLAQRLDAHCYEHRRTYKDNWVNAILKMGLRPEIHHICNASSLVELDLLEIKLIAEARASGVRLTNFENGGRGKGKIITDETRAKMSAARKGKKLSAEHRAKLSSRVRTPEERTKIAAANRRRVYTESTRIKQSEVQKAVWAIKKKMNPPLPKPEKPPKAKRVYTAEQRAKIGAATSKAFKGKPKSTEHRAKLSEALKGKSIPARTAGRALSTEHKAKLSEALKGRVPSLEHRAKLSESLKKYRDRLNQQE